MDPVDERQRGRSPLDNVIVQRKRKLQLSTSRPIYPNISGASRKRFVSGCRALVLCSADPLADADLSERLIIWAPGCTSLAAVYGVHGLLLDVIERDGDLTALACLQSIIIPGLR